MSIVGLILLLVLQAAFEFLALLFKPPFLWLLVPLLTVAIYVRAAMTREIFRLEQILLSLVIGVCLTYDILAGFLGSVSGNSEYPLYGSLLTAIGYFVFSNLLTLTGTWLVVRVKRR